MYLEHVKPKPRSCIQSTSMPNQSRQLLLLYKTLLIFRTTHNKNQLAMPVGRQGALYIVLAIILIRFAI